MKQYVKVLETALDGGGTALQISDILGLPVRQTSAILSRAHRYGYIGRRKIGKAYLYLPKELLSGK